MNKDQLHLFRLIFPGILFFLIYIAISNVEIMDMKFDRENFLFIGIVLIFGVIYYSTNIRKNRMEKFNKIIIDNINNKLLEPFTDNSNIIEHKEYLRENDRLNNIFYDFIDNVKSLSERAKVVYLNGCIWSSLIDIIIIAQIAIFIFFIFYLITTETRYLFFLGGSAVLLFISKLLLPKIELRHLTLSNNEISFIVHNRKRELKEKILKLIN